VQRGGRGWKNGASLCALLLGAAVAAAGQSASTGSLTGRLTDLHSRPVAGATVTVHNAETGAEAQTTTSRGGVYRFAALPSGEYWLEARSSGIGQGTVSGLLVAAGHEAKVQTAIAFDAGPAVSPVRTQTFAAETQVLVHTHSYSEPVLRSEVAANRPVVVRGEAGAPKAPEAPVVVSKLPSSTVANAAPPAGGTASKPEATPGVAPAPVVLDAPKPPERAQSSIPEMAAVEAAPVIAAATRPEPKAALAAAVVPVVAMRNTQAWGAMLTGVGAAAARTVLESATTRALQTAAALTPADEAQASASTIDGEELRQLPLPGRDWSSFLQDTGTAEIAAREDAEGGREQPRPAADVTVDGARTNLAFGAHGEQRSDSAGLIGPARSEYAVAAVQMNPIAAGAPAGERANVETRRGGNGLHGQAFLFDRQNVWNAQNPFTQTFKETAPATATTVPVFTPFAYTPPDRRLTWGTGLGGDLRRNRLFWFAALDGDQRNDPAVATVRHPESFFAQPSNDEMQVLSARLAMSSANPVVEGLGAYSSFLESLNGLLGEAPRTSSKWTGFGRVDWKLAERHSLMLEGTGARADAPGGAMTRVSEMYGTHSLGDSRASSMFTLARWEAFLTPNLLAVTQGSMEHEVSALLPETPSPLELSMSAGNGGQLPQMVVDSRYGFTIGTPARFGNGNYPDERAEEMREGLDWVHGSLLAKAGFEVRHNADLTSRIVNQAGTYHYAHLENFVSDALVFAKYGLADALDPMNQHNCDQRGKAWRDTTGQLHGLGYLPCYSYYTQTLGPTDWHLSTNDWGGFGTLQWQPAKSFVLSAGMRWDREQWPAPITLVNNPDLPLTQKLPSLGNEWEPRLGIAWGRLENHWPVLRLGYGMYYGRTSNAVLETALTQTGSLAGDLNFFLRPTDNLLSRAGGAPPFPYVLGGQPGTFEKPGVVEFAPGFRNPEIHQAEAGIEEKLPGQVLVQASALVSLGRRLPVTVDTNYDPAVNPKTITYGVVDASGQGPIKAKQITVPFFASWPTQSGSDGRLNTGYQQITEMESRANSTYEAAMLQVVRSGSRGLSFRLRYTYGHATDWNPNESASVSGSSMLDPTDFRPEYGTGSLDVRHAASATVLWSAPWRVRGGAGVLANGWLLSGIGSYHSGLPYTMRTAGSIPELFQTSGAAIVGLGPSMNGYGGDPRVYGVGRNTYRHPQTWKADLRAGRRFRMEHARELELLAESFNLFNHQNVTQVETVGYTIEPGGASGAMPTLNFLTGLKAGQTEFGQPLDVNATNFYRERQFDFGFRLRF
jgi:hypothetical protein